MTGPEIRDSGDQPIKKPVVKVDILKVVRKIRKKREQNELDRKKRTGRGHSDAGREQLVDEGTGNRGRTEPG
jgi:hypothetical protein